MIFIQLETEGKTITLSDIMAKFAFKQSTTTFSFIIASNLIH
jgi:hypothetical protein